MVLHPGTRLGPYEVTAQIGVGGMGEVYRATDTSLKRQVAIKVLPDAVAGDTERLARFQREAEVLAQLNHPNIAQIHGLERAGGHIALVMELVEGPTLADRIAQGPIPVDEALPIAKQIAEALEAAHEQGIIHRDLKPANIKVRSDGTVKVLDFGLAKAMEPAGAAASSVSASLSPTITTPAMTQMGMILGTAAYMSPEQARGKPVDKRTDIWAFGCVLYEMLTGTGAFRDEDVSLTLSRVLQGAPDLDALPTMLPASLRKALELCLVKNPRDRVQSIGDVRLMLGGAFDGSSEAARRDSPVRTRAAMMILAAVALAGITVGVVGRAVLSAPAPRRDIVRVGLDAPSFTIRGTSRNVAISQDGTSVIYLGVPSVEDDPKLPTQLWVRRLDQSQAARLEGPQTTQNPFTSPDGQWIGHLRLTSLYRVPSAGGEATLLAEMPVQIHGASWGSEGIILGTSQGLYRVPPDGGDPERLSGNPADGCGYLWPHIVEDADVVLFTVVCAGSGASVTGTLASLDLSSGEVREIGLAGTSPYYMATTGHLVYVGEDGFLQAVAYDPDTNATSARPVSTGLGINVDGASLAADYSISRNGTLVYAPSDIRVGSEPLRRLAWVDRDGRDEVLPFPMRAFEVPRLSPDGTQVAVDDRSPLDTNVWVGDLSRGTLALLTTNLDTDSVPWWSADSQRIVFSSFRGLDRILGVYEQVSDGSEEPRHLVDPYDVHDEQQILRTYGLTPDSTRLLFVFGTPTTQRDLGILTLAQDTPTWKPLLQTTADESQPSLSPDGEWLAYTSDQSGQAEVYVARFPDLTARRPVSIDGGFQPVWSPRGNELFYRTSTGDGTFLISVPVKLGPTLTVGKPVRLFRDDHAFAGPDDRRTYDVSPDGAHFVMVTQPVGPAVAAPELRLILNFSTELERLVPTD